MTAGSGVIHNEHVVPLGKSRILQLWLTLTRSARWSAPRFEHVKREDAPVRREPGVDARVYSGSSGSVQATTHNYVPVTMIDLRLQPGAEFQQELPDSYNGFVYVLDGDLTLGAERTQLGAGQVGWLADATSTTGVSTLKLVAGNAGTRVVLYAGMRQRVPIVLHGPFVGESRADIVRLSQLYTTGRMPRISELSTETAGSR
jgi:hypothetical protein